MIEGGCHCGAIRYRVDEEEFIDAGYCHCDICRQTTGAPLLAWASFPFDAFDYIQGEATVYQSSDWGQREFCSNCGTQVCYRESVDPETVDINIGTLDDPEQFEPEYHVFASRQLDWLDIDDALPRYEEGPPEDDDPEAA